MEPVRTRASNYVYRGPSRDIGDAWVRRDRASREVYMVWELTPEERVEIAAGANVELGIYGQHPIPPVSVATTQLRRLSEAGAALRDRALAAIRAAPGPEDSPTRPGCWVVGVATWADLNREEALDVDDGSVPTLWGRPLLVAESGDRDLLTFDTLAGEEARA